MIVHPLPRTIVHPLLKHLVPQKLERVAGLGSTGEAIPPPNQTELFQLDQVLLGLPLPDADFGSENPHCRIASPIRARVARQSTPGQLRPRAYPRTPRERLRDEQPSEHAKRIEGFAGP